MTGISVVLPVYRTAAVLKELYTRLASVLEREGKPFELIFVNDCSPDHAASLLKEIAASDVRLKVISHTSNQGQRVAVWHGLQAASGDIVITMDADLQDPPEAIPDLLAVLRAKTAQAVFAGRRGQYQEGSRMVTSKIFKRLVSHISGAPPDAGSYVAMTREVVERFIGFPGRSPFLQPLVASTGLPVISIPVTRDLRPQGKSAYSELGRIRMAITGLVAALHVKWWKWTNRQSSSTTKNSEHTTAAT